VYQLVRLVGTNNVDVYEESDKLIMHSFEPLSPSCGYVTLRVVLWHLFAFAVVMIPRHFYLEAE